jgi:hypothetical protein
LESALRSTACANWTMRGGRAQAAAVAARLL